MNQKNQIGKRLVTVLIMLALLLTAAPWTVLAAAATGDGAGESGKIDNEIPELEDIKDAYFYYYKENADKPRPSATVVINAADYDAEKTTDKGVRVETDFKGDKGTSLYTSEEGVVTWKFTVAEAGIYNISMKYFPVEGKKSAINRSMLIDGEELFNEMGNLSFTRVWRDSVEDQSAKIEAGQPLSFPAQIIFRQSNGNEIRPFQYETPRWIETYISDHVGFYTDPFVFYLTEGEHTISFEAIKEPIVIKSFTLMQNEDALSYADYKANYADKADAPADAVIKLQAEQMTFKSDASIYPSNDRSSNGTEHLLSDGTVSLNHPSKQRLNSIDGTKWKSSGQWIEWEFEVEKAGMYTVSFKAKQNASSGAISTRRVLIDGELPFAEAGEISFKYSTRWEMHTLSVNGEECKVYLEAGKHVLRMENALGAMGDIIRRVEESMAQLNRAYRQIHVLTGTTPDLYRDYDFVTNTPEAVEILTEQAVILKGIEDDIVTVAGMRGEDTVTINKLRLLLEKITKKGETNKIAANFSILRDDIGALGTWMSAAREQPLSMDYVLIQSPAAEKPQAEYGFFASLAFEFNSFIASFTEDYDSIGEESEDAIVVWVGNGITGGRDQANIIKQLSDNYFTPTTGIPVNIRLVNMAALMPATLAGIGPDVTLQMGQSDPVNYAFRGAIMNLANLEGFEEVATRFDESALIPFTYRNQVYALPETQSYPMLFYRTDVLAEHGLTIPETWEDVITLVKELNKSQLYFSLPAPTTGVIGAGNGTFAMLLYQNGGSFYTKDGDMSTLNNDIAIDTFETWTSLYTNYQLPVDFDFANRFRTGEMPIAVADYSAYNLLSVSAPEIEGLWDFTLVPGTVRTKADGTTYIDRTVTAGVTGIVIMTQAERNDVVGECWEFLKWWTSADIQGKFGTEMEALLGTAARYQSANLEALDQMPWTTAAAKKLKEQRQWLTAVPEVPGGYYTARQLDFAWRSVYKKGTEPADTLVKYVLEINREIERKRAEFADKLNNIPKEYRYTEIKEGDN